MQFSTLAFHNQVLAGNTPRDLSNLQKILQYNCGFSHYANVFLIIFEFCSGFDLTTIAWQRIS